MQASGEGITLDFDKVDAVEAGVPYLVKPEEVVTEIKADGVMVSAKQPEAFPMNLDVYKRQIPYGHTLRYCSHTNRRHAPFR